MTVIIDGTNGVNIGSGNLTFPNSTTQASAGSVLQVVQGSTTTQVSSSTLNSWVDTTLSASITPKFSTSKILVIVTQNIQAQGSADGQSNVQLLRGSTSIFGGTFGYDQWRIYASTGGNVSLGGPLVITYLDSPATTSSTTYKTQFSCRSGTGTFCQLSPQSSYITLLEIA